MRSKILPLPVLRESIANCQACFPGSRERCRHHEDAVGGYKSRRVVIIGINPQGSKADPVYKKIERLPWENRNALGDGILELFVAAENLRGKAKWNPRLRDQLRDQLPEEVSRIFHGNPGLHTVPFDQHKGLRTWFPCVIKHLYCTPAEFRDHVTIIESVKHTTANTRELTELNKQKNLINRCRPLLEQQLAHLKPRGVIFTGNNGVELARKLEVTRTKGKKAETIGALHGEKMKWKVGIGTPNEQTVDVLFTYAFSQQSNRYWNQDSEGSKRARDWFRERLRS